MLFCSVPRMVMRTRTRSHNSSTTVAIISSLDKVSYCSMEKMTGKEKTRKLCLEDYLTWLDNQEGNDELEHQTSIPAKSWSSKQQSLLIKSLKLKAENMVELYTIIL